MPALESSVIVGAGPAGSAAALLLVRGGAAPLLLERTAQVQPRVCGEFVSAEAAHALAALGVDLAQLGAMPTRHLRLSSGNMCIDAELPFTAWGLSRVALDGALLRQAQSAGVRLRRGERAVLRQVAAAGRPHLLQLGTRDAPEQLIATNTLLLACGKSDLGALKRTPRREPEPLLGLQMHVQLEAAQAQALHGRVEVLLFAQGYGGLQAVEGGRANLCLLVPREMCRHGWPALLQTLCGQTPLLAERLQHARFDGTAPQTIYRVPYGHLHQPSATDPRGLWRLGDQAAVIPSFTGDGMAIALHSAALAAAMLQGGHDAGAYHRRLRRDLRGPFATARALYRVGRQPGPRSVLLRLMQRWPSLPAWVAAMTRVPASALRL